MSEKKLLPESALDEYFDINEGSRLASRNVLIYMQTGIFHGRIRVFYDACPDEKKGVLVRNIAFSGASLDDPELIGIVSDQDLNFTNKEDQIPLNVACERSSVNAARALYATNCDKKNPKLRSSNLRLAVESKKHNMVEFLLDNGVDVNEELTPGLFAAGGEMRFTALKLAISECDKEMVKLLLGRGADANHLNFYGNPILVDAIDAGSSEIAMMALERTSSKFLKRKRHGLTALYSAVENKMTSVVQAIINKGIKPDLEKLINEDESLLSIAISNDSLEILKLLLENCDYSIKELRVPYSVYDQEEGLETHMQPLFIGALKVERYKILDYLLEKGFDVNGEEGSYRESPLQCASSVAQIDYLLSKGADINLDRSQIGGYWDPLGGPLFGAARRGNKDLVRVLLARGADVECIGKNNDTLMQRLIKRGQDEMANILLEETHDLAKKKYLLRHFCMACEMGVRGYELIKTFLIHGASLEMTNKEGKTMSELIQASGDAKMIELVSSIRSTGQIDGRSIVSLDYSADELLPIQAGSIVDLISIRRLQFEPALLSREDNPSLVGRSSGVAPLGGGAAVRDAYTSSRVDIASEGAAAGGGGVRTEVTRSVEGSLLKSGKGERSK